MVELLINLPLFPFQLINFFVLPCLPSESWKVSSNCLNESSPTVGQKPCLLLTTLITRGHHHIKEILNAAICTKPLWIQGWNGMYKILHAILYIHIKYIKDDCFSGTVYQQDLLTDLQIWLVYYQRFTPRWNQWIIFVRVIIIQLGICTDCYWSLSYLTTLDYIF